MSVTEETIAKAAGKVKQASAALVGDAGILNTLAGEHEEVATLLHVLASTSAEDDVLVAAERRRELFPTVLEKLLSHAKAEQETLYALLGALPTTSELVQNSLVEHGELESLVMQLDAMGPTHPPWQPTLVRLGEAVQSHVAAEENERFPRALEILSRDRLQELDDDYRRLRKLHKEQLAEQQMS